MRNYGAGTQLQQSGQTPVFAKTYPSGHCAHTTRLQFGVPPPPPPPGGFARLQAPKPAARNTKATIAILSFLMGLLSIAVTCGVTGHYLFAWAAPVVVSLQAHVHIRLVEDDVKHPPPRSRVSISSTSRLRTWTFSFMLPP